MFFDSRGDCSEKKFELDGIMRARKNLETKISSIEGRFKIKKKYVSNFNRQFVYDHYMENFSINICKL